MRYNVRILLNRDKNMGFCVLTWISNLVKMKKAKKQKSSGMQNASYKRNPLCVTSSSYLLTPKGMLERQMPLSFSGLSSGQFGLILRYSDSTLPQLTRNSRHASLSPLVVAESTSAPSFCIFLQLPRASKRLACDTRGLTRLQHALNEMLCASQSQAHTTPRI